MIAATAPSSRPLNSPPLTLPQLLLRVPLAYADSRTWRAVAHILTGGPVAVVAAAMVCLCVASGALSLLAVGLPLFCCALFGCRLLSWLERCRALVVDGNPIGARYHPTDGLPVLGKVRVLVTDPATWRDVLWSAVIAPLGLASLALTLVSTMLSALFLAVPLYFPPASPRRAVVVVLGLSCLCAGPWIVRGLSALQLAAARSGGPDSWTSLISRVSQLTLAGPRPPTRRPASSSNRARPARWRPGAVGGPGRGSGIALEKWAPSPRRDDDWSSRPTHSPSSPWPTCASWCGASLPRSSRIAVSTRRSRRSSPTPRSRSPSTWMFRAASPKPSNRGVLRRLRGSGQRRQAAAALRRAG